MSDPEGVYHWLRLDERVTTSGQPTEDELAAIAALGVTHVVNLGLHTHERALADEAGAVAALGMTYIHQPVDFQNPTAADLTAFCATMKRLKDQTIHVHCIANWRVSAFLYRYHCAVAGMDPAEARTLMVQQWDPDTHDHPDAPAWARFIAASPLANP